MLFITENLAEMLEVNPNTIINWEMSLGLNVETDDLGIKNYSEELIVFFKKVKSLILNGYTIVAIKELLLMEIENLNKTEATVETTIIEKNGSNDSFTFVNDEYINLSQETNSARDEKFNSYRGALNKDVDQSDVIGLFEALLRELKQYTERTIEAEKKVYLLEDFENRVKKEYFELSSDVKQLKSELEEKNQKLKDYEEQTKRLNLMEVQLKIMQLENSRKKIWEFWK